MSNRQRVLVHLFMPGETLSAAIKKINLYDVTKDEMVLLISQYKRLNGDQVQRPGSRVLIPILDRHAAAVFKT